GVASGRTSRIRSTNPAFISWRAGRPTRGGLPVGLRCRISSRLACSPSLRRCSARPQRRHDHHPTRAASAASWWPDQYLPADARADHHVEASAHHRLSRRGRRRSHSAVEGACPEDCLMIHRKYFFDSMRASLFHAFAQSQVDGLNVFLDWYDTDNPPIPERYHLGDRELAYVLATTYHETG